MGCNREAMQMIVDALAAAPAGAWIDYAPIRERFGADARDDLAREQEEQSANSMLNLRQEAMTYTEHDFSYERIAVWEEGARKYAAEQAACAGENVVSIGQARAA